MLFLTKKNSGEVVNDSPHNLHDLDLVIHRAEELSSPVISKCWGDQKTNYLARRYEKCFILDRVKFQVYFSWSYP